jgi:hypothetical protein
MTVNDPRTALVSTTGIVITQEVMYAELRATHDAVIKIGVEVDKIGDHEARLRTIERRMWALAGGSVVLGSVAGAFLSHLLGGG